MGLKPQYFNDFTTAVNVPKPILIRLSTSEENYIRLRFIMLVCMRVFACMKCTPSTSKPVYLCACTVFIESLKNTYL